MNESKAVEEKRDLITVPKISSTELIRLAQERLDLTHLSPILAEWEFLTDEGGKTYEFMVWAPGRYVTNSEVRGHFPKGFVGNTAAFVAWVTTKNPMGGYLSIPDDDRLFVRGDDFYVPSFGRDTTDRDLDLDCVPAVWGVLCRFVAFREVKPA